MGTTPNIFELTMMDVGPLHGYALRLHGQQNDGAYFISAMYINRARHYECVDGSKIRSAIFVLQT